MTDLNSLIPALIGISKQAGDAILAIYNSDDFNVELKADDSPLTRADKASNAVIVEALAKLPFQAPIISEENKLLDYSERQHYTYCWMVDPLDGTKEFIKRNGEFTVNIALIHDGKVVLGVVYVPVSGELYWAVKSHGAFREYKDEVGQLHAASYSTQQAGLKIVASRSHLNEATEQYIQQFAAPELVSKGSSLKLLMVASGEAHVYPRIAPTMEWDTAAAQIIVEEAGGQVLQFETGQPVRYNKPDLLNPYFVVKGQEQ